MTPGGPAGEGSELLAASMDLAQGEVGTKGPDFTQWWIEGTVGMLFLSTTTLNLAHPTVSMGEKGSEVPSLPWRHAHWGITEQMV